MKRFLTTLTLFLTIILISCDDSTNNPPIENVGKTLYALNGSAETLSKINMKDSSVTKDIVITGLIPNRVRIFDERIYIVSSGEDNIKVIDPEDDTTVLETIGLNSGSNPWDIAFANTTKAYVSNLETNTVSVIDLYTNTVVKDINVGQKPEGIIYQDGKIYVTNTGYTGWGQPYSNPSVSVIDVTTDEVISTISTPINPQDLVFAPDGKLHVVCTGDYGAAVGKIAIIDINTSSMVDSVIIGGSPGDIAITKDGIGYCAAWGDGINGYLYSYNTSTNTVINGDNNPIYIGPNLSQLEYDEEKNVLWIPYTAEWAGDGFIQKFDVTTNTVTWISDVVGNGTSAVAIYEYSE